MGGNDDGPWDRRRFPQQKGEKTTVLGQSSFPPQKGETTTVPGPSSFPS
ncbi:hypothetical protein TIFTF001_028439 [Ficus carica]|uniref:Uncharacterized protein n=1 Tax=Ficus carica TaxID=3494 RepID=A0AA88DR38_FICCA|nr:hypothetical protein TIFTF001_028439 [Ficus carica]